MTRYIEDFAHSIYRYRVFHNIEGDENMDKDIARTFLDNTKRGDIRTFDKFVYDYFSKYLPKPEVNS